MTDWRERLVPAALRARLAELVRDDPEVRLLRQLFGEPRIYEWLHAIGVRRDPTLAALVPPLPPAALRGITAHADPTWFLWTGLADAEAMLSLADEFGALRAAPRPRLLDFGSGAGRVLRFLVGLDDLFEAHGCDVHPDQVAWCAEALRPLRFARNEPTPPLPYPDAHFDAIWALSVFTHLDAEAGDAWRAESARVLKPGGVLVATLHGPTATARLAVDDEVRAGFRLDAAAAARLAASLAAQGFVFLPYDADVLATARAGPRYGSSFFTPAAALRAFETPALAPLVHRPGALRGWQDVIVARRR